MTKPFDYAWALECWREMMVKFKAGRPRTFQAARSEREILEALDYAHQSEETLLTRAHAAEDLVAELVEVLNGARALIYAHVDADSALDRIDSALAKARGES